MYHLLDCSTTTRILTIQSLIEDCDLTEGCVAGGAIRDCLLGREPKDYDIFLFDTKPDELESTVHKLLQRHPSADISDNVEKYYGGSLSHLPVLDATCWGLDLQFVSGLEMTKSIAEVVDKFVFTISMGACNSDGDFIVPPCTQHALDTKQIIVNPNFVKYPCYTKDVDLIERGRYLADKLDFKFSKVERRKLQRLMAQQPEFNESRQSKQSRQISTEEEIASRTF